MEGVSSCLGLEGLVQEIAGNLKDFAAEERHDEVVPAELIPCPYMFFLPSDW
jgi:hypothetical protein